MFSSFYIGLIGIFLALSLWGIFSPMSTITTHAQSSTIQAFKILDYDCLIGCGESQSLLPAIVNFLLSLAPYFAIIVLMIGGYQYFLGNPQQGMKTIQAAVIGLLIVLLAQFIINTVVQGTVRDGQFTPQAIIDFINSIRDNLLIPLASVVAIVVIIIGGYQYIFSGVPGAKQNGLNTIINGVVGLVVILLAIPLINALGSIFSNDGDGQLSVITEPTVAFIMQIITGILIPIVSVVTAFFFIIGGYLYLTARGDQSQVQKAVKTLQNATIGLIIVLLSFTLVQIVILITRSLSG